MCNTTVSGVDGWGRRLLESGAMYRTTLTLLKIVIFTFFSISVPGWALDGTNTAKPRPYSPGNAPHYGYMEYLPAGYKSGSGHYPLVIFLHGIGERGNGTSELSRVEVNGPPRQIKNGRDFPAIVISPQAPPSGVGWFWEGYIVNLINHCKTIYRIDPDRVYVTGISAGGGTAWYLGDKYPGTVSAIGVICGATELSESTNKGAGLRRLPVWAFHNNDDTTVYPSKSQRNLNAIVKAATGLSTDVLVNRPSFPSDANNSTAFTAGYTSSGWNWTSGVKNRSPDYPLYTLYAKGGHNSWSKTYDNQTFWDWLFAQSNQAPTISAVIDRTIAAGGNTGLLSVTINDTNMHPDYLVLTRTSSNTTAVPLANVVLGGTGGARTVFVTGASAGSSTITLTVSDGIRQVNETFVVTVGAGTNTNTAPAISTIVNQSVTSGLATAALTFTVSDAETPAGSLTLSAESTNTTVVPLANITFGGSGGARTVTVTSAAGQAGQSTVRIRVSDGSLTASTTFVVTVSPAVNVAPFISQIANQTVISGNATAALAFTVSDAETPAGSLTLTRESSNLALVPLANIVFGGAGGSRTVTVTPVAGQTGQSTIRIRVSDGDLTASKTFVLTVGAPVSSVNLLVNFQPAVSANPTNALPDSGRLYGNRGTGYSYGWNQDIQESTRDRNESPDQAHDTLIYVPDGARWEIALPNGSYSVRVVAGDPIFANGLYVFSVEGVAAIAASPTPGDRWLDHVVTVTVSDGRLTVTQGASAVYGKLCFLEILSVMAPG